MAVTLSVVIPVYNEGEGIQLLVKRLKESLGTLGVPWEVILVDDHSIDSTPEVLQQVCAENAHFRSLRLSRNSGSHIAILAGLEHSQGDCAVFMAADLQDPPELIGEMLALWRQGYKTIWAVRAGREDIVLIDRVFSHAFYWLLNRFGELTVPPDGADFAMVDRRIIQELSQSVGANPSLFLEIAKLGFPQATVSYIKEARKFGSTKWNMRKKLKAFADAFVSFSYAPMRAMSYLGLTFSALGFLYASYIFIMHILAKQPIMGYASLMVGILVIGGVQMIMLGVLGEYLWRTLDEARDRPHYFLEDLSENSATAIPNASAVLGTGSTEGGAK
jgi:dolichol-phosphate mannosyltransferase